VVREGVGAGGRNEPSLYAHMNNKRKMKKKIKKRCHAGSSFLPLFAGSLFSFFKKKKKA
jgi:hypothetical protein